MIHDIDLVLTLVGERVDQVHAVGVPVLTPFVDIANARMVFSSGAVANITASRVSRERMRKLRIFQQSGYLSLDLASGDGEFYRLGESSTSRRWRARRARSSRSWSALPIDAPEGEPLRLELESFVAAVQGRAPVAVTRSRRARCARGRAAHRSARSSGRWRPRRTPPAAPRA